MLKKMNRFEKIEVYNRYDHSTLVPAYINPNYIVSINVIADKDETWYMLYLVDGSFRLSKESYEQLINLVYGKEFENGKNN